MSDHSDQDNEKQEISQPSKFDDYSNMDKAQIPYFEKNAGTESFKNGDYFEATKHYSKAVMAYQFLIKDGVVNEMEEIQKMTQEIYLPCNLNISLCYIKQKDYQMGRDFAKKALEVDANNIKGLYRRGICLLNLQEFKAAGEDFKKVLELDPNNEEAKQAWDQLVKKKEQIKQKQKAMSEKMLNSLDYQDKIEKKTSKEKVGWLESKFKWLKDLFCMRKKKKQ